MMRTKKAIPHEEVLTSVRHHKTYLKTEARSGARLDFSGRRVLLEDFSSQNMSSCVCEGTEFVDCQFNKTQMMYGAFKGAIFIKCSLNGAKMWRADFTNAEVSECDLSGVSMTYVHTEGAVFRKNIRSSMSEDIPPDEDPRISPALAPSPDIYEFVSTAGNGTVRKLYGVACTMWVAVYARKGYKVFAQRIINDKMDLSEKSAAARKFCSDLGRNGVEEWMYVGTLPIK